MKFIALIYQQPGSLDNLSKQELDDLHLGHEKLQDASRGDRVFVLSNRLHNADLSTTITKKDGEQFIKEGSASNNKEVLSGYYLFECENNEHALRYAKRIPMTEGTKIEVRPVARHLD